MRFERRGDGAEICTEHNTEQQKCVGVDVEIYRSALAHVLDTAKSSGIISEVSDINKVGVRVVSPGTFFQHHRLIDDAYISELVAREAIAPLHIPVILQEIKQVRALLPSSILVATSDSAFHSTMTILAKTYSIKSEDTKECDIYRFGYHGLSCASVLRRSIDIMGSKNKIIIAHIGSGVSLTAVREGKSIDTSMGFSPASGMVMGTRAGDVEAGALLELMRVREMDISAVRHYLQNDSGLKGIAKESDLRHLLERKVQGDKDAINALELFAYQFKKQFGSLVAVLGGLDAVIITATAAERNPAIRSLLLGSVGFGVELDESVNELLINHDGIITSKDSKVAVALIRTDEFMEMARLVDTFN